MSDLTSDLEGLIPKRCEEPDVDAIKFFFFFSSFLINFHINSVIVSLIMSSSVKCEKLSSKSLFFSFVSIR